MRFRVGDIVKIARDSWDEINDCYSTPDQYPKNTEGVVTVITLGNDFPCEVDFHLDLPFAFLSNELRLVRRP